MRTFAQKPKATQQTKSAKSTIPSRSHLGQSRQVNPIFHLQHTIGNQAVQRLLHAKTDYFEASLARHESTEVEYDFSQIPVHVSVQRSIQPILKVSAPRGKYEREADQVTTRVVQQRVLVGGGYGKAGNHSKDFQLLIKGKRANQTSNQIVAETGTHNLKSQIEPGSNLGKPLDASTKEEMNRKIGFDFSNVSIHTDDSATYLNKGLNAKAFTYGSDIYFDKGEYNPNSSGGKRILAHELIHVVQQSRMTDKMIQRTSVAQILNVFFSDFPIEFVWVMSENDKYTQIVRKWTPVFNFVNEAKVDLAKRCAYWKAYHMTKPSWKPKKRKGVLNAYPFASGRLVAPSQSRTDLLTCAIEFYKYWSTSSGPLVRSVFSPLISFKLDPFRLQRQRRPIQTDKLHICAIGSFRMYATVDRIDCNAKTAKMNIWMYNRMSRHSFGPVLSSLFSGAMSSQYMWWNWSEPHTWT